MSIIIETDLYTMLPPVEVDPEEESLGIEPCEPLVVAPVPSETTLSKMDSYDEDLNANPFFQSFMVSCPDLFSQCVSEQWLICVPRRDSLPKYAFTLEDFAHHVLRPIPKPLPRRQRHYSGDSDGISSSNGDHDVSFSSSRSNSSCNSSGSDDQNYSFALSSPSIANTTFLSTISNLTLGSSSLSNLKGNWNYKTLSQVNVEYSGTSLIMDIEVPLLTKGITSDDRRKEAIDQLSPEKSPESGVLDTSSLCSTIAISKDSLIACSTPTSPASKPRVLLDDKNLPRVQLRKEVLFEETFYSADRQKYKVLCVASPLNSKVDVEDSTFGNSGLGLWNLTSLRDCIDFLWVKGNPRLLATFDANIKLFQHNHRGLENFPLKVQKDLVHTLYLKCLNFAITNGGIVVPEPTPDNYSLNEFLLQRLKLATETYVINGIYRSVISALTSFVSGEDARLNKLMRNLAELHPQDLDINNIHWDNLTRARQELGRLNSYTSPLGKLTCMKRTLRYLRPDTSPEMDGGCPLTADELIPIWVYLVVKNPLGNWMAQLDFLQHFRFSTEGGIKDNENSFYITTLEASLEHLRNGKVLGMTSDNERDVGMPCDLGEAWLHSVHAKAMECTDTPLGEMFDVIRLGNLARLEELIDQYEEERERQLEEKARERREKEVSYGQQKKRIEYEGLCHPLCHCENCVKIMVKTKKDLERAEEQEQMMMIPAVELKTEEGLTMLHVACIYGRPKIVEWLIEQGADLEAQDIDNMTPLHFCASRGHQNALLLLLDAGANLEARNIALSTPLILASQNGHEGCVKALIYDSERRGMKLNISARNQKGDTSLHFASRWGFQGIVQILVEHGAAIKIHNIRHVTPLDCAHDIHILKILHRSLRRRSLVEINHGDFINIEMVQKEDAGGIVMLITEPKEEPKIPPPEDNISLESIARNNRSGDTSRTASRVASRTASRKTSTVTMPDLALLTAVPTPSIAISRSRKTSTIVNPMKGIDEEMPVDNLLQNVANHLKYHESNRQLYIDKYLNVGGENETGEVLRKISVQSLEECRIISSESAFTGLHTVMEDTKDHDAKKIFSAIYQNDLPLALFYLGIPAEELANPENDLEEIRKIPDCHPLCPCTRCVAKNAGLGLEVDVMNEEGYSPLHIAVEQGLPLLVKILLRYKANVNCQSSHDKKTPLDIAKEKGFHDIEDTLLACGASETTSFALEPQEFWGAE